MDVCTYIKITYNIIIIVFDDENVKNLLDFFLI